MFSTGWSVKPAASFPFASSITAPVPGFSWVTFTKLSLCAMGVASFSVSVSPEMLTALLAARATVYSLPPAGVVLTVKADLSGTEEVFSASLKVSVSVTPSAATRWSPGRCSAWEAPGPRARLSRAGRR